MDGVEVEALYRREHDRIRAMCTAILRDAGDAEDAVQETFARVAAHAKQLHGDPTGYVVVVARNVCRDELRRRARRAGTAVVGGAGPTPEETAVQRGLLGFVWRHLSRVEQVLLGYVFSGMSMAEIGERTGTSGDAAAQRVSRLRRRIHRLVAAPAALLWPVLQGSAAGRAVAARLRIRALREGLLDRLQHVEQAMAPVLVGVAAGVIAVPQASPPVGAAAGARATPQVSSPAIGPLGAVAALPRALASARAAVPLPSPSALLHEVTPGVPSPPVDASFTSFTPSPDYAHDHVVFAAASITCRQNSCTGLWRSDDAGSTWKPLSSPFNSPFSVGLPPTWPADPTIFELAGTEIDRSDDGGHTFRRVYMGATYVTAAVDPTSQPGNTRIFIDTGTDAPLVYTAADDSLHPLTGLPPDTTGVRLLGMPPYAWFTVTEATGASGLYSCPSTASTCTRLGPAAATPRALSPSFASDHTYFATDYNALEVATLDGGVAASTALPGLAVGAVAPAGDYARSGVVDLVVHSATTPDAPWSGLRVVRGTVQPWALQAPPGADWSTLARLPDGRLLVGVPVQWSAAAHAYSGGGSLCSSDDGATWAVAC